MRKKVHLIFFTICIYLSTINLLAHNLYFKHLGIKDGLSQVSIPSIYQDEFGIIWIGTSEGLNRYNGIAVQSFSFRENYKNTVWNSNISKITGNRNGALYVISEGALSVLNLKTGNIKEIKDKSVYDICSEKDTLWFSCDEGIFYYIEGSEKPVLFTKRAPQLYKFANLYVKGEIIYASTPGTLFTINKHFPDKHHKISDLKGGINSMYVDEKNNIWIASWNGVYRFDLKGECTHFNSDKGSGELSHNQARCITEDNYGNIWIGTFLGLDCYNPKTGEWEHYTEYGNSPNTLSHTSILSINKDMDGNIWAGTYFGGVNIFNPNPQNNYFYHAEPLRKNWLNFPVAGKMTEASDGNIWICTEGGGINILDFKRGTFDHIVSNKSEKLPYSNNIKSIYYKKDTQKMYIGTHLGGLYIYDIKSGQGHSILNEKNNKNSLPHNIVNEIRPYQNGLAILTQGGVVYMDTEKETFHELPLSKKARNILKARFAYETFTIDSRNRIWLGHIKGGVTCINISNSESRYFQLDSLRLNGVSHIYEDNKGEIYVSTLGSGVFHYINHKNTFQQYCIENNSIPNNHCYSVCSSLKDNYLYILHGNGISIFSTIEEKVIKTSRIFNQSYSLGSAMFINKKGTLYIGGTNGVAAVKEDLFSDIKLRKKIMPDRLFIYNREILPGDSTGILKSILQETKDIKLNYRQNNITLEFTSLDYINYIYHPFEYHLSGFDKGWNISDGNRITYTNLPYGDYTLKIRYINHDYSSVDTPVTKIDITVAPPFYFSKLALFIYAIILVGTIILIIRFIIRQTTLRTSLAYERKEKGRIEELNKMKINFFTNISHEFRTPLTLILSQLEGLIYSDNITYQLHNKLQNVYKNAWNLKGLITELMDFQKIEYGEFKLKVEEHDIVVYTKKVYSTFTEYAKNKNINCHFKSLNESINVWFDPHQMQKVLSNIIINALKYTSMNNGGDIYVEIKKGKKEAIISISDTGVGIPQNELDKIFNQFYQSYNNDNGFSIGIGIGLTIAKNIIKMHHGTISVNSELKKGTTFLITIPLGNKHFQADEIENNKDTSVILSKEETPLETKFNDINGDNTNEDDDMTCISDEGKPVMLLVEDNEELCVILKDILQPAYNLHIMYNGSEALEQAISIHPDIIVSDISLPGLSGKELCSKIKNNIELQDVSVILMTGDLTLDNMIESFIFGADDFIAKPFDVRLLQARCRNILKNKKRLISWCKNIVLPETTEADAISEADRKFLKKCIEIIHENFDNQEFDVGILSNSMCMGRSTFYNKFKQIAGISPNEFIAKIKLEEAMNMLRENPELNISEISVRLGFSSPRYFSRMFKSFYGVAPRSVRK